MVEGRKSSPQRDIDPGRKMGLDRLLPALGRFLREGLLKHGGTEDTERGGRRR